MRTLEEVKGRCFITEDGHWLWRGSVRPDGRPNIFGPDYTRKDGALRTQSGARAVWHMVNEKPVPKGNRVYVVCGNATCCNPKCIRCTTGRQYGLWVQRIGRHKAKPKRIAVNRAICAKLTKLNSDQILYVQASPKTGVALAAELGVSEQTISKARRGRNVVTAPGGTPNPFAGLMR